MRVVLPGETELQEMGDACGHRVPSYALWMVTSLGLGKIRGWPRKIRKSVLSGPESWAIGT
jgi:hypothetical protein